MEHPPAVIPILLSLFCANLLLCLAEPPLPAEIVKAFSRDDSGPNMDGAKCLIDELRVTDAEIDSEKTEF
jgi:hypothetical protein